MAAPESRTDLTASVRFTVTDDDTAIAVGSGSLPVLGTPRLLAWCEAATCRALEHVLPEGGTSVGTRVQLEHLRASAVGSDVEVTATAAYVERAPGGAGGGAGERLRLVRFTVAARDSAGVLLGSGEVTRVVVDAERFLARVSG